MLTFWQSYLKIENIMNLIIIVSKPNFLFNLRNLLKNPLEQ